MISLQHTAMRDPRISEYHIRRQPAGRTWSVADSVDEAEGMVDVLNDWYGKPFFIIAVWSDGDEEAIA